MKSLIQPVLLIISLSSCAVEPQEIEYGKDVCKFCKMTIVDNRHASEMVTSKGKVYKFDAIECMINDLKQREDLKIGLLLVSNFNDPGQLIDARSAAFLISESIPSPMGAFLSAFPEKNSAELVKTERGGELFDWNTIMEEIDYNY
jgi:copper chaperone NosL